MKDIRTSADCEGDIVLFYIRFERVRIARFERVQNALRIAFNFKRNSSECGLRGRYRSIVNEIRASADCAEEILFNFKRDSKECGLHGKCRSILY